MLHLRSLTGFSIDLECWNAFRLVNRINSERKVKQNLDIKVWVLWRSSRGHPENVLGTSQINFPGMSHERHFRTSPGHQFGTSPERQTGTSPGRSNRIFRGRPGDVRERRPWDVLGTNICRLEQKPMRLSPVHTRFSWKRYLLRRKSRSRYRRCSVKEGLQLY